MKKIALIDACIQCPHCHVDLANEKSYRLCRVKGLGVEAFSPPPEWCPLQNAEDYLCPTHIEECTPDAA